VAVGGGVKVVSENSTQTAQKIVFLQDECLFDDACSTVTGHQPLAMLSPYSFLFANNILLSCSGEYITKRHLPLAVLFL
jgi:hypothetical protein